MGILSRKRFLLLGSLGAGSFLMSKSQQAKSPRPPALDAALVKDFVGAGHGNMEKVRTMLASEPGLLNASWDWGGGDFETALEAAGHVGNREIAQFLLANGARMNIFCAAMLGQLELVKSILKAFPQLKDSKGPHGLQLIHHAKKGGDGAKEVLSFLEEIGAK